MTVSYMYILLTNIEIYQVIIWCRVLLLSNRKDESYIYLYYYSYNTFIRFNMKNIDNNCRKVYNLFTLIGFFYF